MKLLLPALFFFAGIFLISRAVPPEYAAADLGCGLMIAAVILSALFVRPDTSGVAEGFAKMIRPAPWKPDTSYKHPTARVDGDSVVVSGDVYNLQNKMHYYVNGSGGTWTHLRTGEWRFEHPQVKPQHLADTINKNSNKL